MSTLVVKGFDDGLHQRLRVLAAQSGVSVKALVTAGAIREAERCEAQMALAARAREAAGALPEDVPLPGMPT